MPRLVLRLTTALCATALCATSLCPVALRCHLAVSRRSFTSACADQAPLASSSTLAVVQHSAADVGGAEVVSSAGLQGQLTQLEEKEAGASPQRQAAAAVADREDEDGAGARQRCSSQNPTTQRTMALAVGLVHGACHAVRFGCGAVRLCVVSCCSRHSNYTITRPVSDTLVSSRGCDRTVRARVIV